MRIPRLQLRDFRRHRDLDLALAPGLTVVRGPNESGKSTIQRAIELASRGASRAPPAISTAPAVGRGRRMPGRSSDRVRAGGGGRPEDRHPREGVRRPKGTVSLDFDGESITDPARADQVLAELTGIPTEAFFRSTASVRHHELDDLARDEAALRDRLQASISGADRGTSRAKKKLDKALYDLKTKGDKNPGRLKVAEAGRRQAAPRSSRASSPSPSSSGTATPRRRPRAPGRGRAAWPSGAGCSRRPARPSGSTAERDAAQERFERYQRRPST